MLISCNIVISWINNKLIFDEVDKIPASEYALVLGSQKEGANGINPYFKYRMEAAAELYFNGKVRKIIVSGDNHTATYDEPTDMRNYLIALGVPDTVIISDYAGFRTLDSVVRAKKVFNCKKLIIVSQEFHNKRALFIAKHHGLYATAFNARDVQTKSNFTHFREYLARVAVFFDLYVLHTQPKFPD